MGHQPTWVLSNLVIARFLREGFDVKHKILRRGLTRPAALAEERQVIKWFRQRRIVLANRQQNWDSAMSVAKVISDVKRRIPTDP
jgi:hypothetical protein